jgi:hypothetical protein
MSGERPSELRHRRLSDTDRMLQVNAHQPMGLS